MAFRMTEAYTHSSDNSIHGVLRHTVHSIEDESGTTLGTCFLLPVINGECDKYSYFATCFHCVSETANLNRPVYVRYSQEGSLAQRGKIIMSSRALPTGQDLAVIRTFDELRFPKIALSTEALSGDVLMRGLVGGYATEFTTIPGETSGLETHTSTGTKLLDIHAPEVAYRETNSRGSLLDPHRVWRGFSGSPVVSRALAGHIESVPVIGIVTRIAPRGMGARMYAIPASALIKLCDSLPIKLTTTSNPGEASYFGSGLDLLHSLISDLEYEQYELRSWQVLSSTFFRDIRLEHDLHQLLEDHGSIGDKNDRTIVNYFHARLLYKRGLPNAAETELAKAIRLARHASEKVQYRMTTLGRLRFEVERFARHKELIASGESIFDSVASLLEDDKIDFTYRAYESASLIGAISLACLRNDNTNETSLDILNRGAKLHRTIIGSAPSVFPNQEVVSNFLVLMEALWASRSDAALSTALDLTRIGTSISLERQNAIYLGQMILVRAGIDAICNSFVQALTLIMNGAFLLNRLGVRCDHEGVAQVRILLGRIDYRLPILFDRMMFNMSNSLGLLDGLDRIWPDRRTLVDCYQYSQEFRDSLTRSGSVFSVPLEIVFADSKY